MSTYLITGGAGFIGSNFIKYLFTNYKDIKIINIDKLTYAGNLKNLNWLNLNYNYTFIKEDICNRTSIHDIFDIYKPDYVINFAAESHVDRSIQKLDSFLTTNILGTEVLMEASLKYKVKKFLQISTDEVYGSIETGYFTEDSTIKPNNPYAATKASADLLVQSYYNTHGIPALITRCTNNYGPRQHKEKLIPMIISNCLSSHPIPIYGDGKNIRDWIYVLDHCRAIDLVLNKGTLGEIYNISGNNEISNIEIANLIIEKLNNLFPYKNIDNSLIKYVEDRKGHDRRYGVSSEKIRTQLEWNPKYGFSNSLEKTINWYVKNSVSYKINSY